MNGNDILNFIHFSKFTIPSCAKERGSFLVDNLANDLLKRRYNFGKNNKGYGVEVTNTKVSNHSDHRQK